VAGPNRSPDGAAVTGGGLDEAVQQFRGAAAPLLRLLDPAMRESIERIGRTAEA
jgi:hypothetical protein